MEYFGKTKQWFLSYSKTLRLGKLRWREKHCKHNEVIDFNFLAFSLKNEASVEDSWYRKVKELEI